MGQDATASYRLTRWLFLRLLGAVYLIAFLSLWVQVDGLIGPNGILPLGEHLEAVRQRFGNEGYRILPTLCWLDPGNGFVHVLCGTGVGLALLLIAGVAPLPVLFALWATYLSLVIAGQTFLSFQWDMLLLEAGFAALFFAPARLRPRLPLNDPRPSPVGLWLLRLLVFKLMFLSGILKLASGDETWWNLTALDYHYFTQPLPAWTSWYAQQLPPSLHRASVVGMFVVEIGAPFLVFFPRLPRMVGCFALIGLQALIAATGNYGFFNALSIVLCVVLLDDAFFGAFLPARWRVRLLGAGPSSGPGIPSDKPPRDRAGGWSGALRFAPIVPAAALVLLSGLAMVREVERSRPDGGWTGVSGRVLDVGRRYVSSWGDPLLLRVDPFRSVNGYGLFRVMTTSRPEIVIEGSDDGRTWREYAFRWKPGDPRRRPRFVAPHQPRLDWQMWFAALNPNRNTHWLERLLLRLLQGSPEVLALLDDGSFSDRPPRYVRLAYYRYRFTSPEERQHNGAWWSREPQGYLSGPLSLDSFRRRAN